jgi:hypothetical protein
MAEKEKKELARRAMLVNSLLCDLMISNPEKDISAVDIINHLCLLVQEPILVFLYKKIGDEQLAWVNYFDVRSALHGRGEVKLLDVKGSEVIDYRSILEKRKHIFRVFETSFFIRIFHLVDDDDHTYFREISTGSSKSTKKGADDHIDISNYIRGCVSAMFSQDSLFKYENKHNDGRFVREYIEWIGKIFTRAVEKQRDDGDKENADSASTVNENLVSSDEIRDVNAVWEELNPKLTQNGSGIDRVYRRLSLPARKLKNLAGERSEPGPPHALPNMFWMLRTFDRTAMRAPRGDHPGYTYNVHSVLTHHQKEDISEYLASLHSRLFKIERQSKGERYGDWLNTRGGKYPQEEKYQLLAKELNDLFWERFLAAEKLREQTKPSSKINSFIEEIYDRPFGDGAVSFADPIFHGGLVQLRYPFRRFAGLGRIFSLMDKATKHLTLSDLTEEEKVDCLRIVGAFYFFRGCGQQTEHPRGQYRTKLVVFPVTVLGVVVAVIGTVVFEHHPDQSKDCPKQYMRRLSEEVSVEWDMVYRFYRNVYQPAVRDIRRFYRDIQIGLIKSRFIKNLGFATWKHKDEAAVAIREALEHTARYSQEMARVIPYPLLNLKLHDEMTSDEMTINFHPEFRFAISHVSNPFFSSSISEPTSTSEKNYFGHFGVLDLQIAKIQIEDALTEWVRKSASERQATK